jgi:hypothetical protein
VMILSPGKRSLPATATAKEAAPEKKVGGAS